MSLVQIKWLTDYHDCETCGTSYAEGAEVYVEENLVIAMVPSAHCFEGISYEQEDVYKKVLDYFSHKLEIIN